MVHRVAGCMLILSSCANAEFSHEYSGMLQIHKERDSTHEDCSKGGCKPTVDVKICCEAMTAECLSCSADSTVEEFCSANPKTSGCPEALFTLKQTGGSCSGPSGYLGKESGYPTDLSACKASCAEVAACSHVSFCPSGTACPGVHKNKCALYSTCPSVSDENGAWAGYTVYEKEVPAPTWEAVDAIVTSPFVINGDFVELPNGLIGDNGHGDNNHKGLIEFAMNCDSQVEGLSLDAYVKAPSGTDDSFFLEVAGVKSEAWHTGYHPEWGWSRSSPTINLSAGYNSVKLLAREDGVAIQTLRLTGNEHCGFVTPKA